MAGDDDAHITQAGVLNGTGVQPPLKMALIALPQARDRHRLGLARPREVDAGLLLGVHQVQLGLDLGQRPAGAAVDLLAGAALRADANFPGAVLELDMTLAPAALARHPVGPGRVTGHQLSSRSPGSATSASHAFELPTSPAGPPAARRPSGAEADRASPASGPAAERVPPAAFHASMR